MSQQKRQFPKKRSARAKRNLAIVETSHHETQLMAFEPDTKKKFTQHDVRSVKPLTMSQKIAFEHWVEGQHLVLEGYAGTGKTFLALCMGLSVVLDPDTPQDRIVIVRSSVPTREIGFLPGDEDEKNAVYEEPYSIICDQLFTWKNSYQNLKKIGVVEFHNTSFLRGVTFDNAVIIVDESQSNTSHELSTVATRAGIDSRFIVCGDDLQNDIGSKSGNVEFFNTLRKMKSVSFVNFGLHDIVRSGFVKEFLMAKYQ